MSSRILPSEWQSKKQSLSKHDFYTAYAEELLNFSDDDLENYYDEQVLYGGDQFHPNPTPAVTRTEDRVCDDITHTPVMDNGKRKRPFCVVCKMKASIKNRE